MAASCAGFKVAFSCSNLSSGSMVLLCINESDRTTSNSTLSCRRGCCACRTKRCSATVTPMQSDAGFRMVQLASGSWSVRSLNHRETFHPVIGPEAEAEALYVRQLQLAERLRRHVGPFVIWDVGLGAAANPITVMRAAWGIPVEFQILSFDQTLEPLEFALKHTDQ